MSAAVARQQQQSGHGGPISNPSSRMGSDSPADRRLKAEVNNLDKLARSPPQNTQSRILSPKNSHRRTVSGPAHPSVAVEPPSEASTAAPINPTAGNPTDEHARAALLPPPPPPADIIEKPGDDYFNFSKSRLDQEPNPFEQSFAHTGDTPKPILPPASAITSPAPLIGGQYGFMNSLRSGPLSPAMLQGPINSSLGFDTHIRTGLTPNESGIRSGLTPGGSGSMFPVPSPSAASFLQFGGSTPSTMEFQKTALSVASALRKQHPPPTLNPIPMLTKPELPVPSNEDRNQMDQRPREMPNTYDTDPAHTAANGLYMLAQAHQQNDQYNPSAGPGPMNTNGGPPPPPPTMPPQQMDTSPVSRKRSLVTNTSMQRGTTMPNMTQMTNGMRGMSEISEDMGSDSDDSQDKGKGGAKRGLTAKSRTKSESKANKRAKILQGSGGSGDDMDNDNQLNEHGKKMTDEEKRKNFLERNRVAALKCRQRKKQWLQNLQTKVEFYSQENDALTTQVASLREEIVALKTLLLAHKDCPIARATGMGMDSIHSALAAGPEYGNHPNFGQMIPPQVHGHPRRYS